MEAIMALASSAARSLRVAAMRAISASPTLFCVNGTQNDVIASESLYLLPIRSDTDPTFTPCGGPQTRCRQPGYIRWVTVALADLRGQRFSHRPTDRTN